MISGPLPFQLLEVSKCKTLIQNPNLTHTWKKRKKEGKKYPSRTWPRISLSSSPWCGLYEKLKSKCFDDFFHLIDMNPPFDILSIKSDEAGINRLWSSPPVRCNLIRYSKHIQWQRQPVSSQRKLGQQLATWLSAKGEIPGAPGGRDSRLWRLSVWRSY